MQIYKQLYFIWYTSTGDTNKICGMHRNYTCLALNPLGLLMCFLLLNVYIIKINLYFNAEERHLLLVKCEASIISVHATYFICISSTGISYILSTLSVPDEGDHWHVHCALNLISTVLYLSWSTDSRLLF
jgi:hypothetical protein